MAKITHKRWHEKRTWWRVREKINYRVWQLSRKWNLSWPNRKKKRDEYERAKRKRRWIDRIINRYHARRKAPSKSAIRTRYVRNFSSRRGVRPSLIVMHSTESTNRDGWDDVNAVAGWFDNPSSQASSHLIIDNQGHTMRVVRDKDKAWTQAAYNSKALSIELVGQAKQPAAAWPQAQVNAAARAVARWSKKYSIPIDADHVVTHESLGASGGGHSDPGTFPMSALRSRARRYT